MHEHLIFLAAALAVAVLLTWLTSPKPPKQCQHPAWMHGRCIQCGTPR